MSSLICQASDAGPKSQTPADILYIASIPSATREEGLARSGAVLTVKSAYLCGIAYMVGNVRNILQHLKS